MLSFENKIPESKLQYSKTKEENAVSGVATYSYYLQYLSNLFLFMIIFLSEVEQLINSSKSAITSYHGVYLINGHFVSLLSYPYHILGYFSNPLEAAFVYDIEVIRCYGLDVDDLTLPLNFTYEIISQSPQTTTQRGCTLLLRISSDSVNDDISNSTNSYHPTSNGNLDAQIDNNTFTVDVSRSIMAYSPAAPRVTSVAPPDIPRYYTHSLTHPLTHSLTHSSTH